MTTYIPPSHIIDLNEQIYNFEISHYELSQNLLCIALAKNVVLIQIRFPEDSETNEFEWTYLREIERNNRCDVISFAPGNSLTLLPKVIKLCMGGEDFNLQIYKTDLESDHIENIKGHTNYINDISWEPEGEYLASVSDDYTCKIWNAKENFESVTTFCLTSAGMSVKWHPDEIGKVLVAEKNGIIHLYNAISQQAIMSLESPKIPLLTADWALTNRFYVSALAGGDLFTWDLRRTYRPIDVKPIHEDCGKKLKFCPNTELVIASIGRPENTLKVFNSKSQIPQLEVPLKLYGGLSWHYVLPYIACASDRKLCFWKIKIK